MKRSILLTGILCVSLMANSQVSWKFFAKKIGDKTYEIHLKAIVDRNWHIYSQHSPKGGPLPTNIQFMKNPLVITQGDIDEVGEPENYHDDIFNVDVYSYVDSVDFIQKVKLKANAKTTVNGTVEFMACTKQQCLTPQKLKFVIKLD